MLWQDLGPKHQVAGEETYPKQQPGSGSSHLASSDALAPGFCGEAEGCCWGPALTGTLGRTTPLQQH